MGSRQIVPGLNAAGMPLVHYQLPVAGFSFSAFCGDENMAMALGNFAGDDPVHVGIEPAVRTEVLRGYVGSGSGNMCYLDTGLLRTDAMTIVAVCGHRTSNMTNANDVVSSVRNWTDGGSLREGITLAMTGASVTGRVLFYRPKSGGYDTHTQNAASGNTATPAGEWQRPEFVGMTSEVDGATGRLRITAYSGRHDGTLATSTAVVPVSTGSNPNGLVANDASPGGLGRNLLIGAWNTADSGNSCPVGYVGIAPKTCSAADMQAIYQSVGARFAALGWPI